MDRCFAILAMFFIFSMCSLFTESAKALSPDSIGSFNNGLAPVKKGDLYGFVDKTGSLVIPYRFSRVEKFSEGFAFVKAADSNYWHVIDKNGRRQTHLDFENFVPHLSFKDGQAVVTTGSGRNTNWWLLNKDGARAGLMNTYNHRNTLWTVRYYPEFRAYYGRDRDTGGGMIYGFDGQVVATGYYAGIIGKSGAGRNLIVTKPYGGLTYFQLYGAPGCWPRNAPNVNYCSIIFPRFEHGILYGTRWAKDEDGGEYRVLRFMDGEGNFILDFREKDRNIILFSSRLAAVNDRNADPDLWNFIDIHQNTVVETLRASTIHPPRNGFARFEKDGLTGFIDLNGRVVVPAQYSVAGDFNDGVAVVLRANRSGWGAIDSKNNVVVPFNYEVAIPTGFENGRRRFQLTTSPPISFTVLNTQGETVIPAHRHIDEKFSDNAACAETLDRSEIIYYSIDGKVLFRFPKREGSDGCLGWFY